MSSNKDNIIKRSYRHFYDRFRTLKLTTRITVFNVILFTLLIIFVFLFVSFLTRQFIFYKNREELISKKIQLEEFISNDVGALSQKSKDERISFIYEKIDQLYLFENYKFIVLVTDSENRSSYPLNLTYYNQFISGDYASSEDSILMTLNYEPLDMGDFLSIQFNFDAGANTSYIKSVYIPYSLKKHTSDVFITEILKTKTMHATYELTFLDGSKIFVTLFMISSLDNDYLANLNSALFVSCLIGVLFISIFGRYFTRRALRPLVNLSYTAQNINNENLDYRIPSLGTNDEVDTLIKSLNVMLQNLEKSFDYQRRFVSDASHELRIPLTIILGYMDLLKTMGIDDRALLEESLESVTQEAKNMKNLVEKLLLLARVENRTFDVNFDRLNIQELADKLITECQFIYTDYTFETELEFVGEILADRELLIQIFRALIENAVKYTEKNGIIKITSKELRKYYEISITDNGRGIPSENLPHLTNRFYRVDEDRNRKTGGVGLGLAIVESLMKVQGGKIQIESTEHVGTKIALLFPKDVFMK